MEFVLSNALTIVLVVIVVILLFILFGRSFHKIGPNQVGLVTKVFGKKLPEGKRIAEHGEAGYQPDLLMPGWRMKPWPIYKVERFPLVQIPVDGIGVVVAQVGAPLDPGAKTAVYSDALGDFSNVKTFIENGGQRGIQRPIIPPGTVLAIHPIAFVVLTKGKTYGQLLSEETRDVTQSLDPNELSVVQIEPGKDRDVVGIVTVQDGPPLPSGDIAGRLGNYDDIARAEAEGADSEDIIQMILGTKNDQHNNYQNFQAFLEHGGRMGLQHDPLLYGSYLLNPFLVKVEIVPMLVVEQGEVAVIKSYVGLPSKDTSGEDYKFGSIVAPGHRGIWGESLRTGKYPLNPRIYRPEIVQTSILTLNWADANSTAHNLDAELSSIDAMSKEAFNFKIDLQVQIHVPDTKAPKVIGMVGTMLNLVNEVLQSAVGNYFRNTLQEKAATEFIATRQDVQEHATTYVTQYLQRYDVEVRGVYIQDVVLPTQLVEVLTAREIAQQKIATYKSEQEAEGARVELEAQRGKADAQIDLAKAMVSVDVKRATAEANVAEAEGQAKVVTLGGEAEANKIAAIGKADAGAVEALGLAKAKSFEAQTKAFGPDATAKVAMIEAIGKGGVKVTPDTLVTGSNGDTAGGLVTLLLTEAIKTGQLPVKPESEASAASDTDETGTPVQPLIESPTALDGEASEVNSGESAVADLEGSTIPDTSTSSRKRRSGQGK